MKTENKISLVECPRDAMQGWKEFIPTETKIAYINALLKVGFHTIDFGSFVSHKAIPQMADTAAVVKGLHLDGTSTRLLSIIANRRGAEEAVLFDEIGYLGFPFSISPVFQRRNTNSTLMESFDMVEDINNLCVKNNKKLVVYISMGFGNPYGDPFNESIVSEWVDKMVHTGITTISVADTVGLATPEQVSTIMHQLILSHEGTTIGVHLHSDAGNWKTKTIAALEAGCRRFDGALKGIGGCPMANDELVGNMDTLQLIPYFNELNLLDDLDMSALAACSRMADEIFSGGHVGP